MVKNCKTNLLSLVRAPPMVRQFCFGIFCQLPIANAKEKIWPSLRVWHFRLDNYLVDPVKSLRASFCRTRVFLCATGGAAARSRVCPSPSSPSWCIPLLLESCRYLNLIPAILFWSLSLRTFSIAAALVIVVQDMVPIAAALFVVVQDLVLMMPPATPSSRLAPRISKVRPLNRYFPRLLQCMSPMLH